MSSANKVGEIFSAAGQAFSKLGELTMQLHPTGEPTTVSGKWTEKEVEMLHGAVQKFSEDLNSISENIRNRTITQIKAQMKRKAFAEAGISETEEKPLKQQKVVMKQKVAGGEQQQRSKEVTLTALNAPEGDVDIEVLDQSNSSKKDMDFDSVKKSEIEETVPQPVFVVESNYTA